MAFGDCQPQEKAAAADSGDGFAGHDDRIARDRHAEHYAGYRREYGAFLALLPRKLGGRTLRHVVEVRHDSFRTQAFVALLREFAIPVVYADHATYPAIADVTADFVYARLQTGKDTVKTAYPPKALDAWAGRFRLWAEGGEPDDLPRVDTAPAKKQPRDVFAYVIHEGKIRAPACAMELIARVR